MENVRKVHPFSDQKMYFLSLNVIFNHVDFILKQNKKRAW